MDPTTLLTTVNAFYDQAFNKLLLITFGLIAFIGVIVPLAIGWVQLRTLRAEKGSLLNELRSEVEAERASVRSHIDELVGERVDAIRTEYEKRFSDLAAELEVAASAAEARSFHLQGNTYRTSKTPHLGITDYCHAAPLYIAAADEANAQRCIRNLIEDCLPKTNSEQYKKFKVEENCNRLIKALKKENTNGRYVNDIDKLERQMEKASSRKPPVDEPQNANASRSSI